MDTSYMVYDYPMAPEPNDETEITIYLTIKTSDTFPETWDKEEMEDYVKSHISEYLDSSNIEINEIEI